MKIRKNNKSAGFTIIEVSIVLAIAGLIMAIVFLAVPTLERNTHNTQRTSDATHLAGLISDYQANHNGQLPATVSTSGENWNQLITAPSFVTVASDGTGTSFGSTSQAAVNLHGSCNRNTATISYSADQHFAIGYQIQTSGGTQNVCIDGS